MTFALALCTKYVFITWTESLNFRFRRQEWMNEYTTQTLNIPDLCGGIISYSHNIWIVPEYSSLLSRIVTALTSQLFRKTTSLRCLGLVGGCTTGPLFPVCGRGELACGLETQLGLEIWSPSTLHYALTARHTALPNNWLPNMECH